LIGKLILFSLAKFVQPANREIKTGARHLAGLFCGCLKPNIGSAVLKWFWGGG
jgi:hypothetical protein